MGWKIKLPREKTENEKKTHLFYLGGGGGFYPSPIEPQLWGKIWIGKKDRGAIPSPDDIKKKMVLKQEMFGGKKRGLIGNPSCASQYLKE